MLVCEDGDASELMYGCYKTERRYLSTQMHNCTCMHELLWQFCSIKANVRDKPVKFQSCSVMRVLDLKQKIDRSKRKMLQRTQAFVHVPVTGINEI